MMDSNIEGESAPLVVGKHFCFAVQKEKHFFETLDDLKIFLDGLLH